MNEAIDYFEQSDWIKEVLGTEFVKNTQQPRKKNGFAIQEKFQLGEIEEYLYRI